MVPVAVGIEVADAARVEIAVREGRVYCRTIGVVAHIGGIDLVQGLRMHGVWCREVY